jgi:hypothetical protein
VTTRCSDFEDRVDLIVMGEATLSADDAAHVESCATCRGLLQRAKALEAVLIAHPSVEPSPTFTTQVIDAVRRERWRAEQFLDLGFNVAVAAGVLLIVAGVVALAWRTGLIAVGGDLATLVTAGMSVIAERATAQAQNVLLATVVLTMALGVWWWAEGIEI